MRNRKTSFLSWSYIWWSRTTESTGKPKVNPYSNIFLLWPLDWYMTVFRYYIDDIPSCSILPVFRVNQHAKKTRQKKASKSNEAFNLNGSASKYFLLTHNSDIFVRPKKMSLFRGMSISWEMSLSWEMESFASKVLILVLELDFWWKIFKNRF